MMAKPIRALELHYPMIHFLIIILNNDIIYEVAQRNSIKNYSRFS